MAKQESATWFSVERAPRFENAWDEAHEVLRNGRRAAGELGFETVAVEPDVQQSWAYAADDRRARGVLDGRFNDQTTADGQASVKGENAWHLGKVRSARDAAARAAPGKPSYLEPGQVIDVPGADVRIFVLGPPRDRTMLRLEESDSEMYHLGKRKGWASERAVSSGLALADDLEADELARQSTPFPVGQGHNLGDALNGRGDPAIVVFLGPTTPDAGMPPHTRDVGSTTTG